MLAAAVGLILPLGLETLLLFVIMALLGSGNGAVFQLVPLRWSRQLGVMTGIVGAAGGLGGFALPTVLGVLRDQTGTYGAGFLVFALAALAGGGLLLRIRGAGRDRGPVGMVRVVRCIEPICFTATRHR